MLRNPTRRRWWILLSAASTLAFITLACGGQDSPTKIGEVTSPTSTPQAQSEASQPTPTSGQPASEPKPTDTQVPTQVPANTPAPQGPTTYEVGDIISIGDVVMVVLGWTEPAGNEFNKPDEGNKFVAVELLLVNQGSSTSSSSSLLQMSLKDDTDQRYNIDLMAAMAAGSSAPQGELAPGERVRGKVGFQVPEDATGLVFVFDADFFRTGKAFVALGPEPVSLEPPAELAGEQVQETFAIGDIVSIGDSVMVVLGWSQPSGNEFSEPDQGKRFVAVDVLLVNQGSDTAAISSMLQMNLKDDTGQKYDVDLMAATATGSSTPDGELAPGERVRGKVGFQVPEDAQGLVFVYDAEVFDYGKVFVALGAEPVAVDPPAQLAGEQAQETFAVGDVVQIGDMALTVNEVTYPTGNDFSKPEAGQTFLVVDVTLENKGSEAKSISSLLQMSLKDATGQKYDLDLMASAASGGTPPDGEIASGERVRGQIGFQVPQDAQGLVFVYDAEVFGYGKVFVALQ
jgi:hypothetical protein